jgi:CBS domain-containing protein
MSHSGFPADAGCRRTNAINHNNLDPKRELRVLPRYPGMDLVKRLVVPQGVQRGRGLGMPRLVEEVMQEVVVTVTPDTSVRELLKVLVRNQISGVPVVSDAGEIVGVVSTTDVVRLGAREAEEGRDNLGLAPLAIPNEEFDEESAAAFFMVSEDWMYPTEEETDTIPTSLFEGFAVSDIMTPAAFTVGPRERVQEVAKFLLQGRIHRALVVEDDHLKGIVTAFDLLKAFVED